MIKADDVTTLGTLRREFSIQELGKFRVCIIEGSKDFVFGENTALLLGFSRRADPEGRVWIKLYNVMDLLTEAKFFESKSDVRRAIKAGSLSLNKKPVTEFEQLITTADLHVFGKGKNNWAIVSYEGKFNV